MSLVKKSILIVDDEELNRSLLERRLKDDGYEITVCETGLDALELVNNKKFDLILLDIMLPDISGIKVLEGIRKNPELNGTQVIMVTASDDREIVLQCIETGAADYLIKPFAMSIVKLRVNRSLSKQSNPIEQDNSNVNILLIDDQELNRDVLAHRLRKDGYNIKCASNGKETYDEIGSNKFDLILLDIMLPDINGIEILKEIRKQGNNNKTPVIMVTALDNMDTVNECMDAGADDYILKPLNTTLLKIRVSSCLH